MTSAQSGIAVLIKECAAVYTYAGTHATGAFSPLSRQSMRIVPPEYSQDTSSPESVYDIMLDSSHDLPAPRPSTPMA